jgi:hypothetical protein
MNYKNKDVVDKLVKEHSSALVRFLARRMIGDPWCREYIRPDATIFRIGI